MIKKTIIVIGIVAAAAIYLFKKAVDNNLGKGSKESCPGCEDTYWCEEWV